MDSPGRDSFAQTSELSNDRRRSNRQAGRSIEVAVAIDVPYSPDADCARNDRKRPGNKMVYTSNDVTDNDWVRNANSRSVHSHVYKRRTDQKIKTSVMAQKMQMQQQDGVGSSRERAHVIKGKGALSTGKRHTIHPDADKGQTRGATPAKRKRRASAGKGASGDEQDGGTTDAKGTDKEPIKIKDSVSLSLKKKSNKKTEKVPEEPTRRSTRVRRETEVNYKESDTDDEDEKKPVSPIKEKLVLPTRIVPREHMVMKKLDDVPAYCKEADEHADEADCPFCQATLPLTKSKKVRKALADILTKDREFLAAQEDIQGFRISRPRRFVSHEDRYAFCQMHELEFTHKPEAKDKGWPASINFDKLPARVRALQFELDGLIDGTTHSIYRAEAMRDYETFGIHKARGTLGAMARFDKSIPGYYGIKGAAVIQETLRVMYQDKLQMDIIKPQSASEFIQQVLVPEAGFRLIRDDLQKKRKRLPADEIEAAAKKTMLESVSYGALLHPFEEED
ncbi:RTC4-like domain-containing protein [Gongronella butleri]|nr:RTC4-like domain-containing protein [Gongronella butleri]